MKTQKLFLLICGMIAMFTVSSCKKEKEEVPAPPQLDEQTKQFNEDSNNYKTESDETDNDINNALEEIPSFGRGAAIPSILSSPLCGVTIDSSQIAQKILFFNFDGITPCFSPSRTRSGQIKVQLTTGNLWSDAGSVLTITYNDFKVTRMSDDASVKFNGVKTRKNINGNNWLGFLLGTSTLKYQDRAFNIAVTFDNANATWSVAHITEWSYAPATQNITFTAIGDTSLNGFSQVSAWGINRFGQNFTTYYNTTILSNTYCGLWRPNSGELVHHVNNSDFTLTLGVDQTGNATTLDCAYGYKVAWTTTNGVAGSVILSY
ncbi:MAG TPA: hypothetical protein VJY62_20200 [Bacteroidia bacterium]|nr:hypothetical protein [Bacteroidia bacterium]